MTRAAVCLTGWRQRASISMTSPSTWNATAWPSSTRAGASWALPSPPNWNATTLRLGKQPPAKLSVVLAPARARWIGLRLPRAESAATVRHMLLWINGPFGGGKTATAHELNRRLPGSVVCDPEHVGFGMRRMLPAALWGTSQPLPAWRHSVVELLRVTLAAYPGPVIVPMTLVTSGYFQEIIGSL